MPRRRTSPPPLTPEATRVLKKLGAGHPEELQLRWVEEQLILRVLIACDGHRALAAELLGTNRRTLQRVVRRPKLDPEGWAASGVLEPNPNPSLRREPKRRGRLPTVDGRKVLDLRARKVTWVAITQQLGCSRAGAAGAAKRARREGYRPRKHLPIDAASVVKLRAAGRTWSDRARARLQRGGGEEGGGGPAGRRLVSRRCARTEPSPGSLTSAATPPTEEESRARCLRRSAAGRRSRR